MQRLWGGRPMSMGFAALLFALSAGYPGDIRADTLARADDVPTMTIKIFNDDPDHWAYPVLTTGKREPRDIWLQAFFKVPLQDIWKDTYISHKAYRIYINPEKAGIPPKGSVILTVPLYTQRVKDPKATEPDQYIDWWNGTTIQLYTNSKASPPKALTEAYKADASNEIKSFPAVAVKPQCPKCQDLKFYAVDADLPKNDPSQLLEFTLGARIDLGKVKDTEPPNGLDLKNVDFDVSYVNVAYGPAAMGPVDNDQVGYVGTPMPITEFNNRLNNFLKAYPKWPRFVKTYTDGKKETLLKFASPLELFARLSGKNAPPDLTPVPAWPKKLWDPIQDLRTNWIKFAGTVKQSGADGACKATAAKNTFCDAVVDSMKLMLANYKQYKALIATAVPLTDDLVLSHVYGWTPFVEAVEDKKGCDAGVNTLPNTPGFSANKNAEYRRIKLAFDKLNYGTLKTPKYVFNPWVQLIHNKNYLNTPNAYAYSVDDAVGNIQANATGIIIDIGSTKNLENQDEATPPVNISLGYSPQDQIRFTRYRICKNDEAHEKPVIPSFPSFVVSANNPQNCPIFLFDNKPKPQLYTFKLTKEPPYKVFTDPSKANWSTAEKPFDCSGNTKGAPYQPSSATWCCNKSASAGLYAFSSPDVDSAHNAFQHFVQTGPAEKSTSTPYEACNVDGK